MRLLVFSILLLLGFMLPGQPTNEYICPPCGSACDKEVHDAPGVCSHCNMVLVRKDRSKTIAFYLQDRVEVLDFAGPMEVFSYAGYKVFTVSKTREPIKSQGILTVVPDYSIEDAPEADILAFFGGNSNTPTNDKDVINWVKSQEVDYHFSVCTGAFILAESGKLDGLTATTFHTALDGLEKDYPKVDVRRDVRFVDNGKVITTAGISAGIDGALHLVAKLQGLNAAKRTAYYMEYDNWIPGKGLLLTDDSPYAKKGQKLTDFEGTFEFRDGSKIQLIVKEDELYADLSGTLFPLYPETKDVFSDVNSEPVFFEREGSGEIIGYRLQPDGNLFKKLK